VAVGPGNVVGVGDVEGALGVALGVGFGAGVGVSLGVGVGVGVGVAVAVTVGVDVGVGVGVGSAEAVLGTATTAAASAVEPARTRIPSAQRTTTSSCEGPAAPAGTRFESLRPEPLPR
jgi:hypothetical protein